MTVARDPAVDALLIAETLIRQFDRLLREIATRLAEQLDRAIGEAQQVYPAIWSHLDAARAELAGRGADIARYDAIRARQPRALLGVEAIRVMSKEDQLALAAAAGIVIAGLLAKGASGNKPGRSDAVAALAVLREAMPGVDWAHERADGEQAAAALSGASVRRRWKRLAVAAAALAIVVVGSYVAVSAMRGSGAATAPDASLAATRRGQVDGLRARLAKQPCEAVSAELLVKQLIAIGEPDEATRFGTDFVARCGDNAFIREKLRADLGVALP